MRSKWTTPELPQHLQSLLVNLDGADAFELDARLREVVALDQRLEAEIGSILALVAHEQRYLCHGFRSMEDYARERLGMAAGKTRTLLRLERTSAVCPALTQAYRDGRLSWVQAGTLAPVVLIPHGDLPNREAWVEWATRVSVRRLKEDVEWALLLNQTEPERFAATGGLPAAAGYGGDRPGVSAMGGDTMVGDTISGHPILGCAAPGRDSTAATTAGHAPLGGATTADTTAGDGTPRSATANGTTEPTDFLTHSDRQIGAQPRVSREDTLLYFHAPRSVARLFRAVLCTVRRRIERQTGKLPTEGEAFEAMLDHVFDVWGDLGKRTRATHRVFERDGWRCTVPGCSSLTNLHDHHIVFRSAGGSNDLGNRTTLCVWHHLRGVHGGTVRCLGKAPHVLRFEIGLRSGVRPLLGFESGDRRVAA